MRTTRMPSKHSSVGAVSRGGGYVAVGTSGRDEPILWLGLRARLSYECYWMLCCFCFFSCAGGTTDGKPAAFPTTLYIFNLALDVHMFAHSPPPAVQGPYGNEPRLLPPLPLPPPPRLLLPLLLLPSLRPPVLSSKKLTVSKETHFGVVAAVLLVGAANPFRLL